MSTVVHSPPWNWSCWKLSYESCCDPFPFDRCYFSSHLQIFSLHRFQVYSKWLILLAPQAPPKAYCSRTWVAQHFHFPIFDLLCLHSPVPSLIFLPHSTLSVALVQNIVEIHFKLICTKFNCYISLVVLQYQ